MAPPVIAQENNPSAPPVEEEGAPATTPPPFQVSDEAIAALKDMEEYTRELVTGLDIGEGQYIYGIRVEYGVIRSVKQARDIVAAAIEACGDANPDMAETLDNRFAAWDEAVMQAHQNADQALEDAIERQSFRPVSRVNRMVEKVETAFQKRDENIERIPVTSEKACNELLENMDGTQENITATLTETATSLNDLTPELPPEILEKLEESLPPELKRSLPDNTDDTPAPEPAQPEGT
jgi:hypothetical protein